RRPDGTYYLGERGGHRRARGAGERVLAGTGHPLAGASGSHEPLPRRDNIMGGAANIGGASRYYPGAEDSQIRARRASEWIPAATVDSLAGASGSYEPLCRRGNIRHLARATADGVRPLGATCEAARAAGQCPPAWIRQ